MPRHSTLKSTLIDMVVFVGMFALLGHLSINFWERFVIQTELPNMKNSLHSLKETINRIGYAYDDLHRELLELAEIAEKKQTAKATIDRAPEISQSKKKQNCDKIHKTIPVNVIKRTENHTTITAPVLLDKTVQHSIADSKKNKTTQNFIQEKKRVLL